MRRLRLFSVSVFIFKISYQSIEPYKNVILVFFCEFSNFLYSVKRSLVEFYIKNPRVSNLTYTKHYYIGSERISAKIGTSTNLGLYSETLFATAMPQISHPVVRNPSNQSVQDAGAIVEMVYSKFNQPLPENNPMPDGNSLVIVHNLGKINYFYFHPDHLGSSSYITNKAGVVSQHMEYLPFGETLVDEHLNSYNSPFKYNGKEYDAETGNYYYGARYYDPKWSIFISVDPLAEQTFDSYGYVYNNPINLIDPTGMAAEEIDDHWEIKNGKAHLVDTVGDDIFIKNEGDKDYKPLSKYDFTENMSAAKDIVAYYSSENILSSVNGGDFELNPSYFKTEKRANMVYPKNTAMAVNGKYEKGGWFTSERLDILGVFILIDGKFNNVLDNKYNMRNSIGHEYKHFLEFLGDKSKINYGFEYKGIFNSPFNSKINNERRAIEYQRQLPS